MIGDGGESFHFCLTIMKNRYAVSLANVGEQSFYSPSFLYNYLTYNGAKAVMLQWMITFLASDQQCITGLQVTCFGNKEQVKEQGDQSDQSFHQYKTISYSYFTGHLLIFIDFSKYFKKMFQL